MAQTVKTRIAIISDTHAAPLYPALDSEFAYREGLPKVDILIHCGDMTNNGYLEEYERTLAMLDKFDAELKLFIAGNHDISLDREYYRKMGPNRHQDRYDPDLPRKVMQLFNDRDRILKGYRYLPEDMSSFRLKSGARFKVYSTPYQPVFCNWAFAYRRTQDRFNSQQNLTRGCECITVEEIPDFPVADLLITHGPPMGHLDKTIRGDHAGCRSLQRACARAMPLIHCFGHIHEGRGAERVKWSREHSDWSTDMSVESVQRIMTDACDESGRRIPSYIDVSNNSKEPLQRGKETLMVNASIMTAHYKPYYSPWIIDVELPVSP